MTSFDAAGGVVATRRRTSATIRASCTSATSGARTSATSSPSTLLGWEHFTAPTTDGTDEIDAWIMRPADFDETKRYPVLLNVHGGPHTQYGEYFFDEFQMQAAAGFVVVLGNPRGSSGRHTGWGQAIQGPKHPTVPGPGWGTVDVDDVLAIIDTALDRYDVLRPRPRRACSAVRTAGSWPPGSPATTATGSGRSAPSGRSTTRPRWSGRPTSPRSSTRVHGVNHLDGPDEYVRMSPIRAVRNIDKPMLIIHSEEDWRCPIGQAEELWVALKLLGKEVDFYRFPGENHELSRSGSPVHRVQRAEIILDWFAEKLA